MLEVKNIEKLKQLMSELSDAIIECTDSDTTELDVKEMIVELSSYTNYDVSAYNLDRLSNDDLMTILSNIIRRAAGVNYELSIEQMTTYITDIISEAKIVCEGRCYSEFEKAYSEAPCGSTIKLLDDINLTVPSAEKSLITIDKSIIIDANNHWITPIFGCYVFDIVTMDSASYFKLLNCNTLNGTALVHLNSNSTSNIELNNVYVNNYSHMIYTRRNSYGNVTLVNCKATEMQAAIAVMLGDGNVKVIDCYMRGSGHALQSEVGGSTVIKRSDLISSQKDFAVVRRSLDNFATLDIYDSYIRNEGVGGIGCGIYCPTKVAPITLYGRSYISGTMPILSASTVIFGKDFIYTPESEEYTGMNFVVINSTEYYFYQSIQDAEEKHSELTSSNIYAATEAGLREAELAGYSYSYNANTNSYLLQK